MTTPTLITDQADLHQMWRTLMGPWGFSSISLWFVLIDADRRPLRQLAEVADCDRLPMDAQLTHLMQTLRALIDDGESVAFLLSRPGSNALTEFDQAWADATTGAAERHGIEVWPFHVATRNHVQRVGGAGSVGLDQAV